MNSIVAELLILSIVISGAGLLAYSFAPPTEQKMNYEIKVADAYPPASSGELFDVIMISGKMRYAAMHVVLINSSSGSKLYEASYRSGMIDGGISATINDPDGVFNAGDYLRFRGNVTPGIYEVIITDGKQVAFDGRIWIQ